MIDVREWEGWTLGAFDGTYWKASKGDETTAVAELDVDILAFFSQGGDEIETAIDLSPSQVVRTVRFWARKHGMVAP